MEHSIGEPRSNIGPVCGEHAPKPDPRYLVKPLSWFKDKIVKLGFPVGPNETLEHMWVQVTGISPAADRPGARRLELRGLLCNDSIFSPSLLTGTQIEFDRAEVEALYVECHCQGCIYCHGGCSDEAFGLVRFTERGWAKMRLLAAHLAIKPGAEMKREIPVCEHCGICLVAAFPDVFATVS